jgi:acetylornithine deacetylase/succinyl-diaminopimelate desuccinylase-like protein
VRLNRRQEVINAALDVFDRGDLFEALARRVAYASESQDSARESVLSDYLDIEIRQSLEALGFVVALYPNPLPGGPPFLIGRRIEQGARRTVLLYGHGDVVRGDAARWEEGLAPFALMRRRAAWYGRGSADNKGQHSINLAAMEQVLRARGRLGFNATWLFEVGEERGSPGLDQFCLQQREALAANVFLASDGPRLNAASPTLFLGSRGCCNFELTHVAREGAHHSGNWGGLLLNPGVRIAHAVASLTDAHGRIAVAGLKSPEVPASVTRALASVMPGEPEGPRLEPRWGDAERSFAERVFASNALEVLAFDVGNASAPVNAIPGSARAYLQLRFVPGCDVDGIVPALRAHLDQCGFADVAVALSRDAPMAATRLDPDDAFAMEIKASIERTVGAPPVVLPSLGGSLPNACFAETLGLATVWVPHSYPGCNQHAPNEHLLEAVAREALAIMTGIFYDLGSGGAD